MRTVRSSAVVGLLIGAFATLGCTQNGSYSDDGGGGFPFPPSTSSGWVSASTSASGAGAAGGGTGGGAGEGGSDGAGGAIADPAEHCPGCARLSVPLTRAGQWTQFIIVWDQTVDVTGATVTFRVKTQAGSNGGVQAFVQNGPELVYAPIGYAWNPIADLDEWTDIVIDVEALAPGNPNFNRTTAKMLGLMINAANTGPWANPTVIYVDSITVTKPAPGAGGPSAQRSAGRPSGERGDGGAGGEGGAWGEGGAGGASGDGGGGGSSTSASSTSSSTSASSTSGVGGAGGEGGGSSVEVIHIVGPYEFTTGVAPMKINEFMPVAGSLLTHIAE
ncbi:hypothetical protein WME79_34310 [Sorangium sp. So ce726]|uniref:hypothetical protein n=1 Tax=Sorangium sp. So ce726 TaxID=3133319 RepID=UPI003F5DBC6E